MWIFACPSTPTTAIIAATIATTATMAEAWWVAPGLLNRSEECCVPPVAKLAVDCWWRQLPPERPFTGRATQLPLPLTRETAPDPPTILTSRPNQDTSTSRF